MEVLLRTVSLVPPTYASPTERYLSKSKAALTAYRIHCLFAVSTIIMAESLALYGCYTAIQTANNITFRVTLTVGIDLACVMIVATLVATACLLRQNPYPLHLAAMDCERILGMRNLHEFKNHFADPRTLFDYGIISTAHQAALYQLYQDYEVALTAQQKHAAETAFRDLLAMIKLDLPFIYADV